MHHNILTDLPSIPTIPSPAPLHIGITTRVMARRQSLQKGKSALDVDQNRQRSSLFLTGTQIPNSVIRFEMENHAKSQTDFNMRRSERDELVQQLIKSLQQMQNSRSVSGSLDSSNSDRASSNFTKESQSLTQEIESRYKGNASSCLIVQDPENSKRDLWPELKKQRRISCRTTILAPLNGERQPTYESIQNAILNSAVLKDILYVDYVEEQRFKNAYLGISQGRPITTSAVPSLKKVNVSSQNSRETNLTKKKRTATKASHTKLQAKKSVVKRK
ncbi:hypothetical protein PPYR_12092 [Photinus pyralis]|uniref:Uncharacterized protein n=1 Tax=Photinus pyralis TaxID=7054 RepID=A0A1Y1KTB8_PHOPY|nr:hypothetical protein PPYR_12092 [Photinus pyralis]